MRSGAIKPVRATPQTLSLSLNGAALTGAARKFVLTGKTRLAHNAPAHSRQVDIQQTTTTIEDDTLKAPPISATLYSLTIR